MLDLYARTGGKSFNSLVQNIVIELTTFAQELFWAMLGLILYSKAKK